MNISRKRLAVAFTASLATGLLVSGGVAAWSASEDTPEDVLKQIETSAPTAPPERGEDVTIGPWQKDKPAPDLVPVDLEDGRSGYLRTYDLAHGSGKPEFTRSTGKNSEETVLPVYAEDGQTKIGEFVAGTASWE